MGEKGGGTCPYLLEPSMGECKAQRNTRVLVFPGMRTVVFWVTAVAILPFYHGLSGEGDLEVVNMGGGGGGGGRPGLKKQMGS